MKYLLLIALTTTLVSCKPHAPATGTQTGQRNVMPVGGMHCENCEIAIKQIAMTCDGVNDVAASALDEEVVVWVAPGTDLSAVKAKIASLGFKID